MACSFLSIFALLGLPITLLLAECVLLALEIKLSCFYTHTCSTFPFLQMLEAAYLFCNKRHMCAQNMPPKRES